MRRSISVLLTSILIALQLAGASIPVAGVNAQRAARIPSQMQSFVDRGEVAGVVALVARKGQVAHLSAVGFQDLENKVPMKTDSIFQIMSMTKPITAVGVMILAEQGKLSAVDPVEKYLPEFRGQRLADGRAPSRAITLRDLMTHTSGMPANPPPPSELYTKMDRSLAESVGSFGKLALDFDPGTKWQYSNTGIATLGRIIEVVSGQAYERFIGEAILTPLGMKDTFFFAPSEKTARIALVYKSEKGKLVRSGGDILGGDSTQFRKGAKYPAPEFALYSTAQDLANFYSMMLNSGTFQGKRILSPAAVKVMTMPHTAEVPNSSWWPGAAYGLAWEVVKDPLGALTLLSVGSYGHGGAFGTQGWVDPAKELVTVFMVQHSGGGGTAARNAFVQMANAAVE